MIARLSDKAPAEVIPVTFDFTELRLPAIDSATVSISVKSGTDAGVASMLYSSHAIVGNQVRQLVQNGIDNVIYLIRADVVSGSEKYALAAYLPCRELA